VDSRPACVRLRRTSIVAAPLLIVTVAGLGAAVVATSWAVWSPANRNGPWWLWIVVPGLVGVAALVLARGCLVTVDEGPHGEIRDVVCWRTRRRIPAEAVDRALVQRGPWRLFVLRLDSGEHVPLLGASPTQWPTRLLPSARQQDVEDLQLLLGGDPPDGEGEETGPAT